MPSHFPRPIRVAVFVILACMTPAARAALNEPDSFTLRDAEAVEAPAAVSEASSSPFDKGSWSIYAHGMYYMDIEREDTTIGGGTLGVGYYFKDNQSWNFQLAGYDLQQDDQPDKYGGSFDTSTATTSSTATHGRSSSTGRWNFLRQRHISGGRNARCT